MYFIECHSRAFNLTQLSPVVVLGSVRSTPCQVSTDMGEANNKATGTVRKNQATRMWIGILRIFIRFPDLIPACCTTCVASEPASSTPAYLPELTPVAENIDWNCRYLQKWLVEQRLWVCHRFQTRSLHDFLILHTKVDTPVNTSNPALKSSGPNKDTLAMSSRQPSTKESWDWAVSKT